MPTINLACHNMCRASLTSTNSLGIRQALVFPKVLILAYGEGQLPSLAFICLRNCLHSALAVLILCFVNDLCLESNCLLMATLERPGDVNSDELVLSHHENRLLHGWPTESCSLKVQQHNDFVHHAFCSTDVSVSIGMIVQVIASVWLMP